MDLLESVRKYLQPPLTEADVTIKYVPFYRFLTTLSNHVEFLWEEEDYSLAKSYYERMLKGEKPPAIIVKGWNVMDGFHRLWAWNSFLQNKATSIPVIDLNDLYDKIDEWYPEQATPAG